jgi:hypothetical protein
VILFFCFQQGLIESINIALTKKEDDEDKPELTRKEVLKFIQSERARLRGTNLSGQDLSKLVSTEYTFGNLLKSFDPHLHGLEKGYLRTNTKIV